MPVRDLHALLDRRNRRRYEPFGIAIEKRYAFRAGARPVIVEDGAFIGSRAILTEGVRVGAGAVLGPNVSLTSSVPIIDVTGDEPAEHRGYVPPRAIVVPGTRPKDFPAGTYHLACALIVGWRSESTDLKVSLNDALREHGL